VWQASYAGQTRTRPGEGCFRRGEFSTTGKGWAKVAALWPATSPRRRGRTAYPPLKKRGKLANSFFFAAQVALPQDLARKTEFANAGKLSGKLANSVANWQTQWQTGKLIWRQSPDRVAWP